MRGSCKQQPVALSESSSRESQAVRKLRIYLKGRFYPQFRQNQHVLDSSRICSKRTEKRFTMQSISIHPLTLFYFALGLVTLSGFGILFLNEETILAICFFIFLYLVIQNSELASQALNEQKELIKGELLTSLIKGQKNAVNAKVLVNHRKYELTLGLANVFKDCDVKVHKILVRT
jgi:Mitochondrial ATP synthase B chain precursor (ATP-synt_B)